MRNHWLDVLGVGKFIHAEQLGLLDWQNNLHRTITMTTPRAAAKRDRDNRLFAMLLHDEWIRRCEISLDDGVYYNGWLYTQATYTRASAGYCYALALREIAGG